MTTNNECTLTGIRKVVTEQKFEVDIRLSKTDKSKARIYVDGWILAEIIVGHDGIYLKRIGSLPSDDIFKLDDSGCVATIPDSK